MEGKVSYHVLTSGSSKCLPLRFAAGMPAINVPAVLQPGHPKVLMRFEAVACTFTVA